MRLRELLENTQKTSLPTENSLGKPIAHSEEALKNFWNWFSGSKVVDSQGRPLVVYHATNNDFINFDIERSFGVAGQGVYTTNRQPAGDKYGGFVMILYAAIKNPVDFSSGDQAISDMAEMFGMVRLSELSSLQQIKEWSKELRNKLKKADYDGAFIRGEDSNEKYFVSFDSSQVKSAIGNIGSYADDSEEIISEAPLPAGWDKDVYTPQTSYKKRIEYAVARAQKLGKGSSRTAFTVTYENRPTVLKVAHNQKGMAQNEAEAELLSDGYLSQVGIMIPIIDYDEEHEQPVWIHTEKATKATEKQLCTLMCCGKLSWLVDAANAAQGKKSFYGDKSAEIVKMYGEDGLETFHEYVDMLQELVQFDINLADFNRVANWGIFNGDPVVIDVGFTQSVGQSYYGMR